MGCGIISDFTGCENHKPLIDSKGWFSAGEWLFKVRALDGNIWMYSKCGNHQIQMIPKKKVRTFESINNETRKYRFEVCLDIHFLIESVSWWEN
jgi:hypothetical protein